MHATTPRILLADDHEIVRAGLAAQLGSLGDYEFVHAWSLDTLLAAAGAPRGCELAIVDVYMPGMGDGQGIAAVCAAHPHLPLIILSGAVSLPHLSQWQRWPNVQGIFHKSGPIDELRSAIDLALQGKNAAAVSAPPPVTELYRSRAGLNALPARQLQVARAAASGASNKQIAADLGLTEGTVKQYLKEVFRALGVSNRTQLALLLQPHLP